MDVESLFDKYAAQDDNDHKSALTRSAIISHNTDPERHVANINKAKKQGMPPALATPATKPVNSDDMHSLINDFHNLPPATGEYLADPDNAKKAHDDHPILSKIEGLITSFEHSTAVDVATSIGSTITSPLRQVVQGYRGVAAVAGTMAAGRSFDEALQSGQDSMQSDEEKTAYKPETGAGQLAEKVIAYPFKKWSEAGEFMIPAHGHPTEEAIARTAWEFLPFLAGYKKGDTWGSKLAGEMADGQVAARNAAHVKMITDAAKESALAKRSPEDFKKFTKAATKKSKPVSMPVEKFDEMLADKGLKPEDVLDDPTHYYEAKFEGGKVDIPLSDLAGMAEHVTPEHIKEMSVDGAPSVADIEAKETAKVETGKEPEKPAEMIRPAVKVGEELKTGADGERHTDIVKDAPEADRGFTLDGKTMLDRKQGAEWLKENKPDLYEKLPQDQKAELHSEGLWQSQGVEVDKRNAYDKAHEEVDKIAPTIKDMKQLEPNHIVMDVQTMGGGKGKKISAPYDGTPADALRVAKALKLYASEELDASMRDSAVYATGKDSEPVHAFVQGEGTTEMLSPDEKQTILLHAGINPLHGVKAAMEIVGDIRDSKVGKQVERLMTPGLEAATGIKRGIQSLVLPTAKSPEHLAAAEVLGAKLGKMHRNQESAASDLRREITMFEKMGVSNEKTDLAKNAGVKFMSDMSQGRVQTPKLEAAAKKINSLFDDRLKQLEEAGVPLQTVRENYFPGMWTNDSRKALNLAVGGAIEAGKGDGKPLAEWSAGDKAAVRDRVKQLMEGGKGSDKSALAYLTKTPFKGKESFRKGKVFDDIMDAVEFGLEPVSRNPIDLVKLKLAEMDRSIMANSALQDWRASGDEKFLPVNQQVPEGWQKVNDKYGTVYGPMDMAGEDTYVGRPLLGHRIVKEPVADILNNYLSSSMYNNKYFGTAYKGYMGMANALNQSQLGVGSFFHVGFTESEVIISGGANLVKDLYGVTNGTRTVKQLANTALEMPKAFIKTPMEGDAILKAWRNTDAPMNPRMQQVAKAAELAGGGFKLESGLRTDQTSKMVADWYSDKKIMAAVRSPIAGIEMMAKPIMDYLVPRQKAGVFGHLVDRIIEQNPGKALEELTPQFRQAWNRVDARLGQVRYDRLFLNNSAKSTVQALIRAPGWSGGTIAEIGGAFKDAAGFLKEWADTGKAPAELPDRVAYTVSLMATMTAVNGLLTYAFTGDKPNGTDFWAFRTGGTDEYGRPERFVMPTYQKDVFAYMEDPGKTLLAKTHPIISIMGDLIKNRDYYGVTIANEDDNEVLKEINRGEYVLKQFAPFWMRGAAKEAERGGGLTETLKTQPQKLLAPQIGIMPATSAYTLSPAEKLMNKYIGGQIPQGGRTQEAADTSKARRELVRALRNGATVDSLPDKLQERLSTLTGRQIKGIEKEATLTPLQASFQHLSDPNMEKSIKVWAKATDDERDQLRDVYETKINKYILDHDLEGEELDKLNERIEKAEDRK